MIFYYGINENKTIISQTVLKECKNGDTIFIPSGDLNRAMLFGDPLPGIVKSIFIDNKEFKEHSNVYIINGKIYQIDNLPVPRHPKHILSDIHNSLLFKGNLLDEYPEQLMAVRYIHPNAKVLEIGSNIGRNTLVIASLLVDSSNLTTLESDPDTYRVLLENINANQFQVKAINAALSKNQLVQQGWNTMISDTVPPGFKIISTIHFKDLGQTFDTLVIDCEGAFYYILQDFPDILNDIKVIIMENDYLNIEHKNYIDSVLFQEGFKVSYSEAGGWGPCKEFFYEVFERI
jgi:FkbM family methyltransferase